MSINEKLTALAAELNQALSTKADVSTLLDLSARVTALEAGTPSPIPDPVPDPDPDPTPDPEPPKPDPTPSDGFTFALIGDYGNVGSSIDPEQAKVRDVIALRNTDTILSLGDSAYDGDSVTNYDRAVLRYYEPWLTKGQFLPTRGNHDRTQELYMSWFGKYCAELKNTTGPYGCYTARRGDLLIVSLNTEFDSNSGGEVDKQLNFAKAAIETTDAKWTCVIWHKANRTSGGGHEPKDDFNAIGVGWKRKPDIIAAGHNHVIEHLRSGGIDYIISGSGGYAVRTNERDTPDTDSKFYFDADFGYVELHVTPTLIEIRVVDIDGKVRYKATLPDSVIDPAPVPDPIPDPVPDPTPLPSGIYVFDTTKPILKLTGEQGKIRSMSLKAGHQIDAIDAAWRGMTFPVALESGGPDNVTWVGGFFTAGMDRQTMPGHAGWDALHSTGMLIFGGFKGIKVHGARFADTGDCVRVKEGCTNFVLEHCYAKNIGDDAIENDKQLPGTVRHWLVEGCHTGISTRMDSTSAAGGTLIIENCLILLEPSPATYKDRGAPEGNGAFFKQESSSANKMQFVIKNCIFAASKYPYTQGDKGYDLNPRGTIESSGNQFVWLGSGADPFGDQKILPGGWTRATNASVWANAAAEWKQRHGI